MMYVRITLLEQPIMFQIFLFQNVLFMDTIVSVIIDPLSEIMKSLKKTIKIHNSTRMLSKQIDIVEIFSCFQRALLSFNKCFCSWY